MRIGIISLIHESNTFISTPMTIDLFRRESLLTGEDIAGHYEGSFHEVGGFIAGVSDAGEQVVPIFAAWGMPAGMITGATFDELRFMMFHALDQSGSLDGLLVAPHGAAVSEGHRDMDGQWLTELRDRVGPDLPIVCTLDPHANITPRMIDACDATIAYRTNPHVDQRQRGIEAAQLLMRMIKGEVKPTQAASYPPIAINIAKQETAVPPCRPMYERADQMLQREGVLSNSVIQGFPYADVEEMGAGFVVVTDNDKALAQQLADELADYLWQHRHDFLARLIDLDEGLDQACATPCDQGAVCLLDMGDNVGGGSPGDSTFVAHAMHQRRIDKTFVAISDPECVQQAAAAGVGARLELRVGGKTDDLHGKPLVAHFTMKSMHDGTYSESEPRHGGRIRGDMGKTAIVETDHGLTVQLTSYRTAPFTLSQLRSCQLDPAAFRILVAKGVNAPVAAYREVCKTFIRVNTPGSTSADLETFDFQHRRRPMFPFEEL